MELIFSMGFFIFYFLFFIHFSNPIKLLLRGNLIQSYSSHVGPWSSKSNIPNHNRPFLLRNPTTSPYSMFLLSLPLQYSATSLSLRFLFFFVFDSWMMMLLSPLLEPLILFFAFEQPSKSLNPTKPQNSSNYSCYTIPDDSSHPFISPTLGPQSCPPHGLAPSLCFAVFFCTTCT